MTSFKGIRVEISPSHDLWMAGARFGTIREVKILGNGQPVAVVKMDHGQVKRLQTFKVADLSARLKSTHEVAYLVNFAGDGFETYRIVNGENTRNEFRTVDQFERQ